ncbi:MAG: CAP domain-containing protein [Candidatus Fermentibacterota bacterium]
MHLRYTLIALLVLPLAAGAAGGRRPELDYMARAIYDRGAIPRGPELILLGVASGWSGTVTGIRMGDSAAVPEGTPYGAYTCGGTTVTVLGSFSRAGLRDIAPAGPVVGEEEMTLAGLGGLEDPLVTLMHPDLSVDTLLPDGSGWAAADLGAEGVHWLEITSMDRGDPKVVCLLPLVRGLTMEEALAARMEAEGPSVSTAGDVLDDLNRIRAARGLQRLGEDPELTAMARARAAFLAESGQMRHLTPGGTALPEMMRGTEGAYAENIAMGAGWSEAWSMIRISPTHMASCLRPGFGRAGIAAGLAADSTGWQMVMVQVFADGSGRDTP